MPAQTQVLKRALARKSLRIPQASATELRKQRAEDPRESALRVDTGTNLTPCEALRALCTIFARRVCLLPAQQIDQTPHSSRVLYAWTRS